MKIRREILEGEEAPRGYGLAYYRWERNSTVWYPIPLNLGVAFYRWVWHGLQFRWVPRPGKLEREIILAVRKAYREGYRAGRKEA